MITRKWKLNSEEVETGAQFLWDPGPTFASSCLLLTAILLSVVHGDDVILAGEDT